MKESMRKHWLFLYLRKNIKRNKNTSCSYIKNIKNDWRKIRKINWRIKGQGVDRYL